MVNVNKSKSVNLSRVIIFGAFAVTLAMTPGLNKDSLIIPKMVVLFSLSLFLLPFILFSYKDLINTTYSKTLFILESTLVLFGVLVLTNSSSPIDQLIFGRTGRGLGLITFLSCVLLTLASLIYIRFEHVTLLLKGIVFAGLITSFYSCIQYFGVDIFKWDSKTNGIIGTLGNPNSQSSFAAMIFIPAIVFFWQSKFRWVVLPISIITLLFTIYISQSTQGYIGVISAIATITLIYLWFNKKVFFWIIGLTTFTSGITAILGMLGHGPLSYYLYKVSVQSRGDFWRSAFTTGNAHPIFGVGFDSFGDYSLKYRDEIAASHSFAEYTDSAHNFYLDYLATGGYLFLILNIGLTLLALRGFYVLQKNYGSYNRYIAGFFCAWLVIQLQTMINTQTITFLTWNAVFTGAIIGMSSTPIGANVKASTDSNFTKSLTPIYTQGLVMLLIALFIMFPYFNTDRLLVKAANTGNGDLLIQAVTSYPQSVTKYSQASRALLESGLPTQSLFLAKKAVQFNPQSVSLWALILINTSASIQERIDAKNKILELDPLNNEVKNFEIK